MTINKKNISLSEMSKKQIIALLQLWDCNYAKSENSSFSEMLKRCYKTSPWHENSPILYAHPDGVVTSVNHAFFHLNDGEEEQILKALSLAK